MKICFSAFEFSHIILEGLALRDIILGGIYPQDRVQGFVPEVLFIPIVCYSQVYLLPACARELGNVIGLVSVYIYICMCVQKNCNLVN